LRSIRPGARALIIAALIGTTAVSLAPASTAIAVEPTEAPSPAVQLPTPVVDPAPAVDPASALETADDPSPAPDIAGDVTPASVVPPPAKPKTTEAQQIIRIAKRQIGDPWRHGARGPIAFDCSGLVIYAYTKAGDSRVIGRGRLASARAMYRYFKAHHQASRSHPRVGDLVIWGRGTHVGIYIGNGKAISTLTRGVRIHRVHAVTARFTAYLHTGMWRKAAG